MRIETILVDGAGREVRIVAELDEQSPEFLQAVASLAMRARDSQSGVATALGGALRVTVIR